VNVEEVREYCLALMNTEECFPFDDVSLVFKVENKMYLLMALDANEPVIAVKCDPELIEELRERYKAVCPAYHFNKKYWNNIYLNRDMPEAEIKEWINHSYREVIAKLPKKVRDLYEGK